VSLFAHDKITLKIQNVNKRRQDIDKNVWESRSTGWNDLLRNFQTRNGVSVVLRTFRSDSKQWGPLNEHPVVDVNAWHALLRTLTLWGTCRINARHTAPLNTSHESSEYLKQITGDDFFLFSFAMNVNEQRIIVFLTEKCCYLNLRSKVRTQLRWCGKFYHSRM